MRPSPGASGGRELHRHRRRHLRAVRPGRRPARRHRTASVKDPGLQSLRRGALAVVMPSCSRSSSTRSTTRKRRCSRASAPSRSSRGTRGAPPHERRRTLALVGAVLVASGRSSATRRCSSRSSAWSARGVRFAGSFGGYFSASVSPLMLAYVLAASVPGRPTRCPDRVLGWVVAGLVSTVAALVLWPRRERPALRSTAAPPGRRGRSRRAAWPPDRG